MSIHNFRQIQVINSDIDTVWRFFSSPRNLNEITPRSMNFEIIDTGGSEEMYEGQLIKYRVSPFPFLRVNWVSEISGVVPHRFFTDSQKKGPFATWHHRHIFSTVQNGVEMIDQVSYSIPFGYVGDLANRLLVARRLNRIFEFRRRQIESIFPGEK